MTRQSASNARQPLYRVDKFIVPETARKEFLEKVLMTHAVLKAQPGFVQDFLLEQCAGPGEFNFVTFVEWESTDVIEGARKAVTALHQKTNFNPQEMFARLGIKADLANYKELAA